MALKRQALKNVKQASWLFGHPVVRANLNSVAYWSRPTTAPLNAKGGGWMPCLHGRVQTNDDWAALYVPVNEYPIGLFTEAQWSYYMTTTQTMGANIVFWVHDPDDFNKRAEITQLGGHADLGKTAGYNAFEFTTSTGGMFWYGEDWSGSSVASLTGSNLTAGTQYTWAQFQTDNLFKDWLIYRISIEMGWEASGTFDQVWIAEVKLNEVPIPLIPREGDLVPVHTYYTGSADITTGGSTCAPKTPFQLLNVSLHMSANPGATSLYTIQVLRDNDKHASDYDAVLHYSDLRVPTTTTTRNVIFGEGYEFDEDDVIDVLLNGNGETYGLVYTWKPL